MKKVMALALTVILLLSLCACGTEPTVPADGQIPAEPTPVMDPEEPEIPLPDARGIWETAETKEYSSVDIDVNTRTTIRFGENTIETASDCRVKAMGMKGADPRYQIVTTGDAEDTYYYGEGLGYFDGGFGCYCQKMTEEEFLKFYKGNEPDVLPDCFDTVEFDGDNTVRILFSGAREEYADAFIAAAAAAGMQINRGSLSVSGSITLDGDGNETAVEFEASMTAKVAGEECDIVIRTTQKMLSYNSETISINAPAKLTDYSEVVNLSALRAMYEAMATPTAANAVDYKETVEYHLTVGDAAIDETDSDRIVFAVDKTGEDLCYYEEYSTDYGVNGEMDGYSYTADYTGGNLHMAYSDGDETDTEIDSATMLVTIVQLMTALNGQDYLEYYSEINDGPETEGKRVITFRADETVWMYLIDSMLSTYSDDFSGMVYYGNYSESVNECVMVLDKANGSLESFGLYGELEIDLGDGETVAGSVRYTKDFQAYGNDVFLTSFEEKTAA